MLLLIPLIGTTLLPLRTVELILQRQITRSQIFRHRQRYRVSSAQYGHIAFAFDDKRLYHLIECPGFLPVKRQDLILLLESLIEQDLRIVQARCHIA